MKRGDRKHKKPFSSPSNALTSLSPRQIAVIVFLTLLSIIPIWIIPVAPLSDWTTHVALSREAFWLLTGHVSQYYAVDFSFLGYQTVYLLLIMFQYFVDWQTAGKLLLSLLMVLAPFCWWLFFRLLDRTKESWLFIGSLIDYTWFFYVGTIPYVLAVHLGIVFLAFGIRVLRGSRKYLPLFIALGLLTFLTHAYVAFVAFGILFVAFALAVLFGEKRTFLLPVAVACLAAVSAFALFSAHAPKSLDAGFYDSVKHCVAMNTESNVYPNFAYYEYVYAVVDRATFSHVFTSLFPFSFFYPLFPWSYLMPPMTFLSFFFSSRAVVWSLIAVALGLTILPKIGIQMDWLFSKEYWRSFFSRFKFNKSALAIAIFLFVIYLLLPDCNVVFLSACPLNTRLIPFAFAFLALGIRHGALERHLWVLLATVLLGNIIFQAFIFLEDAPAQASFLTKLETIAGMLPENATVFVVPGTWTTSSDFNTLPFGSHYHALLLTYRPDMYVSGLFMAQNNLVIRSDFSYYDEMTNFGPFNPTSCYASPPCEYGWVMDGVERLRPNLNCSKAN